MVAKVPLSLKLKVLDEWLQGNYPYQNSKRQRHWRWDCNGYHQQARNKDIPDIDLMRKFALTLKKENLDVNHFASAVRLKKVLDRIGLPEDKIELLLEEIKVHCFKR
jgi:hypothetical protein